MSDTGLVYVFISPEASNLEIGPFKFVNRVCKLETKEDADELSRLLSMCAGPLVAGITRMIQESGAPELDALTMLAAQRALNANIAAETGATPVVAAGTTAETPVAPKPSLIGAITTGSVNDKR